MSALAQLPSRARVPSLLESVDDRTTLDELLVGAWEGLVGHRMVCCPICSSAMEPEYGAHAMPIGGRCKSCGSRLS